VFRKNEASQKYEEAKALSTIAFNRWRVAMDELRRFSREFGDSGLSPSGHAHRRELDRNIEDADKAFRQAEDVERDCRLTAMQAELAIQSWIWEEHDRIQEEMKAKAKAAAKSGQDTSLSGRLKALKKKVSGNAKD